MTSKFLTTQKKRTRILFLKINYFLSKMSSSTKQFLNTMQYESIKFDEDVNKKSLSDVPDCIIQAIKIKSPNEILKPTTNENDFIVDIDEMVDVVKMSKIGLSRKLSNRNYPNIQKIQYGHDRKRLTIITLTKEQQEALNNIFSEEDFKQNHRLVYFKDNKNTANNKYFIVCKNGDISKALTKTQAQQAIKEKSFEPLPNIKHFETSIEYNFDKINKYNYITFNISINQQSHRIYKQNFIYKAFHPEYKFKQNDIIDHINGVKTNNSLDNLRQFTKKQNSQAYQQEQKQNITDLTDIETEFLNYYYGKEEDAKASGDKVAKDIGKCINDFNEFKYIGYTNDVHKIAYDIIASFEVCELLKQIFN